MKLPQQRLKLFTPAIAQATAVISSSRATESTETCQTTVFPSSLHSIEQNFYFVQSRIRLKALLPAGIGGTMVADKREQVKIEQNNCYCSVRAAAVVLVMPTFTGKLPHR